MSEASLGTVEEYFAELDGPFHFQNGGELSSLRLVYERYGNLNAQRDNAVLVCHALSGHHHAAGYRADAPSNPGWWDSMIGPGKPLDTRKFCVIATNNLGGCHGSTGPASIDPASGRNFGPRFPSVRVEDWVEAQLLLAHHLGIERFVAVIGGSIGGMQAMSWAIRHPDMLRAAIVIAGTPILTTQNIAFNEIARQAIRRDPAFAGGDYYHARGPRSGLAIARMLGHVTYLSDEGMQQKFGRQRRSDDDNVFQIESYLRYQGDKFSEQFDANTYLIMTEALDAFDPAATASGDLAAALAAIKASFLVVSFKSDWRFPAARSLMLVKALLAAGKRVSYAELDAPGGHDAFLLTNKNYHQIVGSFLSNLTAN